MNFSNELIEKAKTASSAEELLEMAKAEGIELSAAEAETYFSFLHSSGPLSDEELSQVAGGKGGKPNPKFSVGQTVEKTWDATRQIAKGTITGMAWYLEPGGWSYNVHYYQETQCFERLPSITRDISVDDTEYLETDTYCKVY